MPKHVKASWPLLTGLALLLLYTLLWFSGARQIEHGIDRWVERQRAHGTEVSWSSRKISGYPFRLKARFEDPTIFAAEDDSQFAWAGEELRLKARVFSLQTIVIDLVGAQNTSWIDAPADGSRSASTVTLDFSGDQLRGTLHLRKGHIETLETDFRQVVADVFADGAFSLVSDGDDHIEIEALSYRSTIERFKATEKGGKRPWRRTVTLAAENISTEDRARPDLDPVIEEVGVRFTEELSEESALHTGDIGGHQSPALARRVTIEDAHIHWPPLSVRLEGKLKRPPIREGKAKKPPKFDGKITLYLKGHEDLVRDLAETGDAEPEVALVAGALFGVLEMVSGENDEGELVLPLDVKKGKVYFGFLPLFEG